MRQNSIQKVLDAYIDCALWASVGGNDEPLDKNYTVNDLASLTYDSMHQDVSEFLELLREQEVAWWPEWSEEQLGHDFWLTRNGHGTGFWDRGNDTLGRVLTRWAKIFGACDLYVGDDGKIYIA